MGYHMLFCLKEISECPFRFLLSKSLTNQEAVEFEQFTRFRTFIPPGTWNMAECNLSSPSWAWRHRKMVAAIKQNKMKSLVSSGFCELDAKCSANIMLIMLAWKHLLISIKDRVSLRLMGKPFLKIIIGIILVFFWPDDD